jgi:hypothetical protein
MKERYRRIRELIKLVRISYRLPAWTILLLADSIRRAGDNENFHCEIVNLQRKAYEIQKMKKEN